MIIMITDTLISILPTRNFSMASKETTWNLNTEAKKVNRNPQGLMPEQNYAPSF